MQPQTRDEALDWAQRARNVQAEVTEALSAGSLSLSDVLARAATEELVGRLRVLGVLEALPGAGKVTTRRALAEIALPETTPLSDIAANPVRTDQVLAHFPFSGSKTTTVVTSEPENAPEGGP